MSLEAGIRIQYAEGMREITEAAVKRLLKKIRRGDLRTPVSGAGPRWGILLFADGQRKRTYLSGDW